MNYMTTLGALFGEDTAKGTHTAVKAAGHIPEGEWTVHGPIGAPTSATVRCSPCRAILRVSSKGLEMPRKCPGAKPGQWR